MSTHLPSPRSQDDAPDRVRTHSSPRENQRIDRQTQQCLEEHAGGGRELISGHVDDLEREWDVERYLQLNAGTVSLLGVVLGTTMDRRFLVLPAVVFGFFFQHATQGWCPPLPVFRKMGVRTKREINHEKYALKALRGDFDAVSQRPAVQPENP